MQPTEEQKAHAERLDFARQASATQTGFLKESWLFLRENKKWWLTPLILILLLLGMLVGGAAVTPFTYTLF